MFAANSESSGTGLADIHAAGSGWPLVALRG
jgi:hypothetical protein